MKSNRSLITTINKIGTQFTEVIGSLTLFLYHSSQQTPIATFDINHTKANSSVWTTLTNDGTNIMRYLSDDYDAGGEFFLGYAQSDLGTAQALRMRALNWVTGFGCATCPGNRSAKWFQNYSQFIEVIGFQIAESKFTVGVDLFDPQDVAISVTDNYGLNINMTNDCDLTPFFLEQDHLFAEGMNNITALEIIKDMSTNTRGANSIANQVSVEANKILTQAGGIFNATRDVVEMSLNGLSFDLSGLQDECMPCDDGKAEVIEGTVTLR